LFTPLTQGTNVTINKGKSLKYTSDKVNILACSGYICYVAAINLLITLAPEDESPIVQPGQEDCCHQDADRDSERVAEIERERR